MYTPLFAPVGIPMIVGLIKEFLAWKRRRKAKRDSKTGAARDVPSRSEGAETPVETDGGAPEATAALSDKVAAPVVEIEEKAEVLDQRPVQAVAKVEVPPSGRVLRSRRSTPATG